MSTATETVNSTIAARAEGASKIYGEGETAVRALDDVSVDFEISKLTSIMGPSGSGKSTLLHCISGLDSLTSGSVFIGDVDLTTLNERNLTLLRREKIGFVFQSFNLIPTLTAKENMTLPLDLAGRAADPEWFRQVIDTVNLGDRLTHKPKELSGGQQQRVAVARALLSRPEIIFADEPTGNLDSKSGTEILEFMERVVKTLNQTIVMVTHDPVAASYSNRVVFIADGKVRSSLNDPTVESIQEQTLQLGE